MDTEVDPVECRGPTHPFWGTSNQNEEGENVARERGTVF